MDLDPSDGLREALRFAERLGPASSVRLREPAAQASVLQRLNASAGVEDATLAVLFPHLSDDRTLANEFFSYFFGELSISGRSLLNPALRELMETGELVDSVVRDMWRDLARVEFRTRGQFLAFLLRRMQWKGTNSIRSAKRRKRGGDLRPAEDAELQNLPDTDSRSPLSEAEHEEDVRRMAKLSAGLPPADRRMLLMRIIDGHSYAEVGERFGISASAARARIQELVEGLRERF